MNRRCPVCGSQDSREMRHIKMSVPEGYLLPSEFDLICCNQCGFVFNNTAYSEAYDLFYSSMTGTTTTEYHVTQDEAALNADTVKFLEEQGKTKPTDHILDIGCSYGVLLMALKQKGYKNLLGMDLDVSAINYVKRQGISAIQGGILSNGLGEIEDSFDVIVLRHILEHLHDPRVAIQNVSRWLRPGGKLLIEVPNLHLYPVCSPFPGYFVENFHINHFSLVSLMNLMDDWEMTAFEARTSIYPTLRALFERNNIRKRTIIRENNDAEDIEKMMSVPTEEGAMILKKIEELQREPEIAIWGTSVFVHRLLTYTDLKNCSIKFFVDRNMELQGQRIMGIEVKSPEAVGEYPGTIVICGKTAMSSIKEDIQNRGLKNKVICLYE